MASRADDWFRQAERDLVQARRSLEGGTRPAPELVELAKELEKHYIGPRYPNSYPEGAPMDFYTRAEAERALDAAERILEHCCRHLL
jgi:HEPN domain-containing protein